MLGEIRSSLGTVVVKGGSYDMAGKSMWEEILSTDASSSSRTDVVKAE
jgi:hypothetical protein